MTDRLAELEHQLAALADCIDAPKGDTLVADVLARIERGESNARRQSHGIVGDRRILAVAAMITLLVTLGGLLAFEPSRQAIANWLGIGAVHITEVPQLPPIATAPATSAAERPPSDFEGAQLRVTFAIRVPDPALTGQPRAFEIGAAPGGLVSITYEHFNLTEIASQPNQGAILRKLVDPSTRVSMVDVNGRSGAWFDGAPHALGYLDPDGELRNETVRRAGNVLLWEEGGVTYRIEGLASQAEAMAIAASLH